MFLSPVCESLCVEGIACCLRSLTGGVRTWLSRGKTYLSLTALYHNSH
jgi:hypothetical protein